MDRKLATVLIVLLAGCASAQPAHISNASRCLTQVGVAGPAGPIAGATVIVGDRAVVTNADGRASVSVERGVGPTKPMRVEATAPGYTQTDVEWFDLELGRCGVIVTMR